MKKLLFSIPRAAFQLAFFRPGGPGGQKQNKTSSGCRITHTESGAVGTSRDQRSQMQNRKQAFQRLVDTSRFKTWLRIKTAVVMEGYRSIEDKVDKMLAPKNLKIEHIHTYTCDSCNTKQQGTVLPVGWTFETPDTHYCPTCWGRML